MAETLNELVLQYLKKNGIKIKFFANYLQEDYAVVNKWLHGKMSMNEEKIALAHKFLRESHVTVEKIMNGGA